LRGDDHGFCDLAHLEGYIDCGSRLYIDHNRADQCFLESRLFYRDVVAADAQRSGDIGAGSIGGGCKGRAPIRIDDGHLGTGYNRT